LISVLDSIGFIGVEVWCTLLLFAVAVYIRFAEPTFFILVGKYRYTFSVLSVICDCTVYFNRYLIVTGN